MVEISDKEYKKLQARLKELEAKEPERKRAEEKLQESENNYRTLAESVPDAITMTDLQAKITYASPQTVKLHGAKSAEQLIGRSSFDLIAPEYRKQAAENTQNILTTKVLKGMEMPLLKMDGTRFDGELSAALIEDAQGKPKSLIAITRDISSRKRAEEGLQENEKRLKEAQRIGHLGFWDLNTVTGDLYWSDETYRIYGFKPQEFKPTFEKFSSILHPEDREFVQKQVDAALNNNAEYNLDFRFVCPDGKIGCIHCEGEVTRDKKGKPIRFFGTQIDITERKRAEEALRASERRHRTLLENLPQKIFLKDRDSVYVSCNENYARDLKIKADEIAGSTDFKFYPRELAVKYRADDKKIMDSGKTEDIEERYIQDGQEFWVHTVKTPLKDEKGKSVAILGIFWDITDRMQAEKEKDKLSKFMTGREGRVIELKEEVNKLLQEMGRTAKYKQ